MVTQATDPGRVLVALSIQKEALGATGIIRDDGPPYVDRREGAADEARRRPDAAARQDSCPSTGRGDSHLVRFARARRDRARRRDRRLRQPPGEPRRRGAHEGTRAGIGGFMRAGILVQPDGRGR